MDACRLFSLQTETSELCMSGLEAIVDKAERAISFSDRTKSLDYSLNNEKSVLSEFSGMDSRAGSVTNGFKAGEFFLPNGESYSGSLLGSKPEGLGKYVWSDGSEYDGEWRHGMREGYGKFQWPSGALYEGVFSGDYMHGTGTYTRSDGMTYKGGWRLNIKHGLGYQNYPNRDVFEGSWIRGTPEGPGKYTWANRNVYLGNMKGGKMSGKGTLNWINGDSFEGNWLNGMIHGFGVYTWVDGGCYVGTWTRGLKDGKGTFYPKRSSLPAGQQLYLHALRKKGLLPDLRKQNQVSNIQHSKSVNMRDVEVGGIRNSFWNSSDKHSRGLLNLEQSHAANVSLKRSWSLEVSIEKVTGHYGSSSTSDTILDGGDNGININPSILEREYIQGVLISELVLNNCFSPSSRRTNRRHKRLAREIKRLGEQIIKGHRSYDLMISLQLGIRYTVGKITPIQSREVRATDFGTHASFWMNFPREGSQLTHPHQSDDFKWKDYCPMVFRNLREMFEIDAADYMMSICGSDALRELSSPGKSGSVFFLSQDNQFMIKTLRKSEVEVLLRMLPNYYRHVCTYENTLITKFFGLHRITPSSGQKFRFVVMGNMFCTELRIHRGFDLKGSTLGRSADKVQIDENTILKDLDLNCCFYLEPSWQNVLLQQIETDSKFLESENIMDYSLLLGVHHRAPQHLRSHLSYSPSISVDGLEIVAENETMEDEISQQSLVLVPRDADDKDVIIGSHIRGNRLRAPSASGNEEVDLLLPGTARFQIQLGVNMPARAEHVSRGDDARIFHDEAYDVVLYLGIIDILQEYNLSKKIEHAYKAIHFDPLLISAVDPKFYSERFLELIQKVFPPNGLET